MKKISLYIIACLFAFVGLMPNQVQAQDVCDDGNYDCYFVIERGAKYSYYWGSWYCSLTVYQDGSQIAYYDYGGTDTLRVCSSKGKIDFELYDDYNYANGISLKITDSAGVELFNAGIGDIATTCTGCYTTLLEGVTACSPCTPPTNIETEIGTDQISISFEGSADSYEYVFGKSKTYSESDWESTTSTSLTFDELTTATTYYFKIRSICGSDTSFVVSKQFTTGCDEISTLPIKEDFEHGGEYPVCWARLESGSSGSYVYPYVSSGTYYGTSNVYPNGTYWLYMYNYYGNNTFCSPKITATEQTDVIFYAVGSSTPYLEVGYSTDTSDLESFVVVESVAIKTGSKLNRYVVPLPEISEPYHVVFRLKTTSSSKSMYLDDITIAEHSDCGIPTKLEQDMTDNTSGQVTLNWQDTTNTKWQIAYGPTGFDPDDTGFQTASALSTTVTITGLSDDTTYDFYVRGDCGSEYSYWCDDVVTTRPNTYKLNKTIDTITSCGITLVDDGGFGKYGYGYGKSYMMTIMPETDEDAVKLTGKVNLYSYNYSNEQYLTYLYIFDGTDTTGECLARYASNDVTIDNNVNLSSQSGPITLYFKLPEYSSYCGDGFELSVSCYPRPNCIAPSNFTFVGSYGEDAWFSWKPADETPDKYVLDIYDMDGNQVLTKDVDGEASTDTLTSGSLQENTDYKAVLSVVCDGEASSLTREVTFRTPCVVSQSVTIGDPSTAMSYTYTFCGYAYYGHNIGQHLYTADELEEELDTVTGLKLYAASGASTPYTMEIYMENTDETYLSSYISPDTTNGKYSHRVFSGTVNMTAGEIEIPLDSIFIHEADKGILVTFVVNNSSYINTSASHYYQSVSGKQVYLYGYSSATIDAWDNLPTYMYTGTYHMVMSFVAPCGDKNCAPVKVTTQTATQNSITLAWNPGNTETAWNVDYRKASDTAWTNFVSNTAVQSCTITGLESGTNYDVRVVTLCDGEKTIARKLKIMTECGDLEIPHTIDFEGDFYLYSSSGYPAPNCWYRIGNSTSSYSYYPYNYSYYSHDGSYSGYFYQTGDVYFPALVTPPASMDLNKLAVTFYYLCVSTSYVGYVEVGAMSDPTDPSTFELIDTAHYDYTGYNEWGFNVVDLSSYTGTAKHIAIRAHHDYSTYTYVYLDDITIMEKPNCNFLVGSMAVTGLSDNSITVTVKSDRYGHDKYNVYVSTSDVLDKSTAFKGSSTTNVITVTGLTASTDYYVWIEGDCGSGDVSNLMPLGVTRTLCNAIAVTKDSPYVNDCENEEDMLCLWQVASGNSAWHHSSEFTYTQTGMVPSSGTGCYWLQNYPGQSMLCMPTFDFSGLDTVAEFIFSLYQYNYDYYDPVEMSVWYRDSETAEWTKLTDFVPTLGEYVTHYVKLPNSVGAKFYQIGILGVNQNNYYGASLDDFSVAAATPCAPPEFELTDLTSRSFTINWHDGAYDDIRVQYRRPQDWTWSARNLEGEEGTGSGSGIVVPLSMNTTYMVRVAAVCDAGQYSRFSSMVTVTLPMCEDNVTALSYDANSDKVTIQDGLFGVDYYGPDGDYPGFYSYSEVLIDKSQLSGMTEIAAVTFTADSANEGSYLKGIQVYMANTTATELDGFLYDSTFKMVFTGDATYTEPGKVLIPLKSPFEWDGSSNIVIGFYGDGNSYAYDYDALYFAGHKSTTKNFVYARNDSYPSSISDYILNLYDEEITTNPGVVPDIEAVGCKPVCYEPVVKSLTTTSNSIRVEWYREKNMDVEVSIRTTGTTAWDNPVTVKSTDGVAYTFTMLSAMTQYDIRLRRDCSGDGIGFSDEVIVSATTDTACSIPEMVKALDVSATTATLGWSNTTVANRWEIQVWNTGFNKYYKADSNPFTIDGLTPGNSYKVRVRAFCGSSDHVVGDWSETATFQNTCEPVTGLTATANGSNVVLNWTGSSKNKRYLVTWGENHFDPNEQVGYAEVNGTTYTVSGLKSKTYTFRVIGICDEGWYSDWSEVNATVVGIDDVEGQNAQFTLQPNPATDRVTLSLEAFEGTANVSILSVDGRQVSQFSTVENSTEINLSDMAAGTYFVRVQTEGWVSVRKLIVK